MTYAQPRPILTGTGDMPSDDAIAIVGAACHYPAGCYDLDLFWRFLRDGRSAVVEAPPERLATTFRGAEAGKEWHEASQWPLPTVRFRNVHPSRWLGSICAAMNPTVEVDELAFQFGFILRPHYAVHSGSSPTLECVEAVTEQRNRQVVEQSRELILLPFLCCFTHSQQPL